jgi:hypothetical protein
MVWSFFPIAPPLLAFRFIYNLFGAIKPASIHAGTFLACRIPRIGTFQIPLPERPVAALSGSDLVNGASPALLSLSEEYTIARMRVFDNRHPKTHTPEKLLLQLFHRHFQKIGD